MLKPIVWSNNSKHDMLELVDYLISNWGNKVANDYIDIIENLVNQISIFPKLYPIIHTKFKIRKCVISKHNTIYYREKKGCIEIINVFDTQQHPEKTKIKK
ncbi:MAG: type II toxin-antitoxin system RelE/ParE family toxin [Sphingobacteriales bacterium]|nr:MAG: type II toxin-antitoxin system RelE/ParE family toxin [Sphingobacteriales bacterium]TAF83192.1 MAG: type II toxin-antitoxin system RelE/ParE family toxin [Sphingobacteriales bacterium]